MVRDYELTKSSATGGWHWECKDGGGEGCEGWAPTKKDAKAAGAAACGNGFAVHPLDYEAHVHGGFLDSFTVANLDGQKVRYSVGEITEPQFEFFFGLADDEDLKLISDADKAITILKIWGIYRWGCDEDTIKRNHYLSDDDFTALVNRNYFGGTITINDDETITWKF